MQIYIYIFCLVPFPIKDSKEDSHETLEVSDSNTQDNLKPGDSVILNKSSTQQKLPSKKEKSILKTNLSLEIAKTNREKILQFLQLNKKLNIKCEKKSIIVNNIVLKSFNQLYKILFKDGYASVSLKFRSQLHKLYQILNNKQKLQLKGKTFK